MFDVSQTPQVQRLGRFCVTKTRTSSYHDRHIGLPRLTHRVTTTDTSDYSVRTLGKNCKCSMNSIYEKNYSFRTLGLGFTAPLRSAKKNIFSLSHKGHVLSDVSFAYFASQKGPIRLERQAYMALVIRCVKRGKPVCHSW